MKLMLKCPIFACLWNSMTKRTQDFKHQHLVISSLESMLAQKAQNVERCRPSFSHMTEWDSVLPGESLLAVVDEQKCPSEVLGLRKLSRKVPKQSTYHIPTLCYTISYFLLFKDEISNCLSIFFSLFLSSTFINTCALLVHKIDSFHYR